jgi:signal transduction histidine kinase
VIATARVALASASLFGVWMDPTEPARYVSTVYTLHVVFVAYALSLATLVWIHRTGERLPLVTHIGDIIFVSVLQYLTLGPSSPFFLYFIFSLFCAAMRWGWRGTLGTAAVTLATYLFMGAWMSRTLGPTEFEFNRFLIRSVYLIVSAALLVYLGRYEERLRGEIERLARWPTPTTSETDGIVSEVLEHAAGIVGAGHAVVIWDAGEEPAVFVARWPNDGTPVSKQPPGDLLPPVDQTLEHATFFCAGPVSVESVLLVDDGSGRLVHSQKRLHAEALQFLTGTSLASAAFQTERVSGRVFFTDLGAPTPELIPLTEVVAREVGASLNQLDATEHMKQIAASEERIRLARDLHDGVLQSLTGIRLEIRAVAGPLDTAPSVRDRLFAIERALAIEQRELRFFIGGLGPPVDAARDDMTLAGRLNAMRERIALEWKMPVTIRLGQDAASLPERIERAVPLMVHEAVVNALKHGQPSRVAVTVDGGPAEIRIVVSDDGRGFPFRGRYDHATLAETHAGPKSLLDRVEALGGHMSIESTDAGSRIEMVLAV